MGKDVANPNSKYSKTFGLVYFYRIKESDAFNNASIGTNFGTGTYFEIPPILYHHLNGIIILYHAYIGKKYYFSIS